MTKRRATKTAEEAVPSDAATIQPDDFGTEGDEASDQLTADDIALAAFTAMLTAGHAPDVAAGTAWKQCVHAFILERQNFMATGGYGLFDTSEAVATGAPGDASN